MSERERFERWAQTQQWALDRCPRYGHYLVSHIEWQWQAWQARADRAAEREQRLVDALQAVCDCIMDTRGPNAHEAVANARALLATHEHNEGES